MHLLLWRDCQMMKPMFLLVERKRDKVSKNAI
jgi:hypothetical protein